MLRPGVRLLIVDVRGTRQYQAQLGNSPGLTEGCYNAELATEVEKYFSRKLKLKTPATLHVTLVWFFWFLGFQASAQDLPNLADLIERVERSVVRIETPLGIGSGFVATIDGLVVTNLHVIEGVSSAKIIFQDGRSYSVLGALIEDAERDIVILKTEYSNATILPIALALPRKGDSVVTFGAPAGLSFSSSAGIVSAIRSGKEAIDMLGKSRGTWLQTTAPISKGNSGGPLVDREGALVGVNTFYDKRGQNLNFAISCIDINELLQKAKDVLSPKPLSGVTKEIQTRTLKELAKSELAEAIKSYLNDYQNTILDQINLLEQEIKSLDTEIELTKSGRVDKSMRPGGQKALLDAISVMDGEIESIESELELRKNGKVEKRLNYPDQTGKLKDVVRNKPQYWFFSIEKKKEAIEQGNQDLLKLKKLRENRVSQSEELLADLKDRRAKLRTTGREFVLLAMRSGRGLNLSESGTIGLIEAVKVAQVISEHEFHGYVFGSMRVSIQGIPTAKLLTDQHVTHGLFYYSGVNAYETRLGTENRIPEVIYIPQAAFIKIGVDLFPEVEPSVASHETAVESTKEIAEKVALPVPESRTVRTWKDQTGKFNVVATFIAIEGDIVVLEKKSGESIKVPTAKLSLEDQKWLSQRE